MNRIDLGRKLTNAFFFLHNCPWVSYWFCFPTPIVLFCPGHLKFGYTAVLFSGMLALVLCLIYRLLVLSPHNHNLPYVNYVIFNEGSFKISNILMLWMFIKKKKHNKTKQWILRWILNKSSCSVSMCKFCPVKQQVGIDVFVKVPGFQPPFLLKWYVTELSKQTKKVKWIFKTNLCFKTLLQATKLIWVPACWELGKVMWARGLWKFNQRHFKS